MRLLLFDVDQTLIHTGGAGIRALNRAFHKVLLIENAMDGVSPHGKTDPWIVREVLSKRMDTAPADGLIDSILDEYVGFLEEEVQRSPNYRVLPGILEILEEMARRSNVLMGLATGNVEAGARIKLSRGALNRYFPFGGFGSDAEDRVSVVRKAVEVAKLQSDEELRPEDVFVIGDTPRDVEAGREAGFQTVAVASGGYTAEQLLQTGAGLVIPDFKQGRDQFLRVTRIR